MIQGMYIVGVAATFILVAVLTVVLYWWWYSMLMLLGMVIQDRPQTYTGAFKSAVVNFPRAVALGGYFFAWRLVYD